MLEGESSKNPLEMIQGVPDVDTLLSIYLELSQSSEADLMPAHLKRATAERFMVLGDKFKAFQFLLLVEQTDIVTAQSIAADAIRAASAEIANTSRDMTYSNEQLGVSLRQAAGDIRGGSDHVATRLSELMSSMDANTRSLSSAAYALKESLPHRGF